MTVIPLPEVEGVAAGAGGECVLVQGPLGDSETGTLRFIYRSGLQHAAKFGMRYDDTVRSYRLGIRHVANLFHFGQVLVSMPQLSHVFNEDNTAPPPITVPCIHANLYKSDLKYGD